MHVLDGHIVFLSAAHDGKHDSRMLDPAAVDLVGTRLEELTNALAATYTSSDAAPSLALAREAFLDACTQLQEQLMQLKQAVLQSPQQIEDILHQQQQQQQQASSATRTKAQQAPTSTAAAAADKMDVDQPAEQQDQQAAKEVSAAIMQQHASFLAQLTGGPS